MKKSLNTILVVIWTTSYVFAQGEPAQNSTMIIEIRSYNLKPDRQEDFHQLVLKTLPMLERYKIAVVSFGPSLHDGNSYYLIRAFNNLEDRTTKEDAFYGSDEWKMGPRESVIALIETYTTTVMKVDAKLVELFKVRN